MAIWWSLPRGNPNYSLLIKSATFLILTNFNPTNIFDLVMSNPFHNTNIIIVNHNLSTRISHLFPTKCGLTSCPLPWTSATRIDLHSAEVVHFTHTIQYIRRVIHESSYHSMRVSDN